MLLPEQRVSHQPAHSSLGRDHRLRKTSEFQAVRRQGRSWANRLAVVRTQPNEMSISRVGFSVGRQVGNAVVRNRVKRRLREVVRQTNLRDGWDMVFIARAPAAQTDFHQLRQAVLDLLSRANLMQDSGSHQEESR